MSREVAVIDAGTGNLRSVEKALAHVGAEPIITRDPDVVRKAPRVVVPGQGAFESFVSGLTERHLEEALREVIADGRPYLGICLGLQVLFDESEEHGPVAGLGLIPGKVVRFRPQDRALKVPHMGWNSVALAGPAEPLLRGVGRDAESQTHGHDEFFYFTHSYYVIPKDPGIVSLTCNYGGEFAAAIRVDNLFACQFHPEKSSRAGLALLANFVSKP